MGPRRVGVKWSKPINPFGPINVYRIFYSASKIVRREVANKENSIIVSAPKTEVNLTGLTVTPYTNYSIEIAAINIRDGDNKILLGTRSNEVYVQTDEDGTEKSLYFSLLRHTFFVVFSSICSTGSDLNSSDVIIGKHKMEPARTS